MSYSICRIAKVKSSGVTGIQIHDKREKEGVSHTNEDIDWTRTAENVSLIEPPERFRTAVSDRISELDLKRQPRSDATVMCQCLVTSDTAFFDKMSRQEQTEYFRKSLDFIRERYGEENLISATIHYDERTPHMHVNFVPVTQDGRLSAKDLFSPKSLRVLQDDYNRFVREHGYDLERGQTDSKTKHLEVEEYKVETRYKELKAKEQTLERLEQIDTKVGLQAEKGKLTYSTKEVEAIKEQNSALKVESLRKDSTIDRLTYDVERVSKRLTDAQKKAEGTETLLNRLKDLESENKALQHVRQHNPKLDNLLQTFDRMRQSSYAFGEKLAECKTFYQRNSAERERLIQHSNGCGKMAQECDKLSENLSRLKDDISHSMTQETALKAELEGFKGIFRKKAREDCQQRLERQEKVTEQLQARLRSEHNTDFLHIPEKLHEYSMQKRNFLADRQKSMELTDKAQQNMTDSVQMYKFHKGISDVQQADLREISDRIDGKVQLKPGEERLFKITQADRESLLKEYESKVKPETLGKIADSFDRQTAQEQQVRAERKIQAKEKSHSHSRGWER